MGCGASQDSCIIDAPMEASADVAASAKEPPMIFQAEQNEQMKQQIQQKQKQMMTMLMMMEKKSEEEEIDSMLCHSQTLQAAPASSGHGFDLGGDDLAESAAHIDEGIENIVQVNCSEHEWMVKNEYSDQSASSPPDLDFSGPWPHDACENWTAIKPIPCS